MSLLGPVLAIVGAGAAIKGAKLQAQAANAQAQANIQAAEYKRKLAARNTGIAGQQRQAAVEGARAAVADKRLENRRQMAEIRASFGANGVDVAGSPLDILEDSALTLETDALREQHKAQVAGYEGALRIMGLQDETSMATFEGINATTRAAAVSASGEQSVIAATAGAALNVVGAFKDAMPAPSED
ncbi:MAG: hypothetical protein KAR40_15340 [Candidatus Sabulitectum sp.]|nr:hypothetical protein [Candidatus Sabulitectum sp.]